MNYASIPIGSTVAVHSEDGGPWTHGTVVGSGDNNHNNRSYMMCITKTGQLATRNRKHIKENPATGGQYLWDQWRENTVDVLDNILQYFEKQAQQNVTHIQNRQIEEDMPVNITSDIQQRDTDST